MKKSILKMLSLTFIGLSLISCQLDPKKSNNAINVDKYSSFSVVHSYGENSLLAEPIILDNNENFVFLDYTIGSVEKCFIQNVTTPFYYDGHITNVHFTEKEVTSKTIKSGVSNFVSKEKTTSITKKENSWKLNWKFDLSLPTDCLWTMISPKKLKSKGNISFDSKQSIEKVTESIVEQSNSFVEETTFSSTTLQTELDYNLFGYELNKYYSIALVGDVETHQVFVIDTNNKTITAVYFYTEIKDDSTALRMVYADDTNYSVSDDKQIEYIESIDIDFILNKNKGDGTTNNPYLISTSNEFMDIAKDLTSNYKLVNSIDFNGAILSSNMGNFSGTLDGDGNTIYNFTVKASSKNDTATLFYENNGLIKNLKIGKEAITTKFLATSDAHSASAVCTFNNGEIINCSVSYCNIETNGKGGGLVYSNSKNGYLYKNVVEHCYLKCGKTNDSIIGGIAYNCYSKISNCFSRNNHFYKMADGGIVGWFDDDPIHYTIVSVCHNGTILEYNVAVSNYCNCKECKKKFNLYHVANKEKATVSHSYTIESDNLASLKSKDLEFDNQKDYNGNPVWISGSLNSLNINLNSKK